MEWKSGTWGCMSKKISRLWKIINCVVFVEQNGRIEKDKDSKLKNIKYKTMCYSGMKISQLVGRVDCAIEDCQTKSLFISGVEDESGRDRVTLTKWALRKFFI